MVQALQPRPSTRLGRFVQFPLTRIVLAVFVVIVAQVAVDSLLRALHLNGSLRMALDTLIAVPASYGAYVGYVHLIERRAPTELAIPRAGREFTGGLLIGAALFTVTITILWLLGCYHVIGAHRWTALLLPLGVAILAGFTEELLIRGILYRICEESLGTWAALAITAVLFGALHLANPGATLFSGVAIMIEAGILLAAAYASTRRLWLPIGLHIAWNFTQGGIFGVAVSGHEGTGILQGRLSGPIWLSGGAFGVEGSVIAIIVCLAMGVYFLQRTVKQGRINPPFWVKGQGEKTDQIEPVR